MKKIKKKQMFFPIFFFFNSFSRLPPSIIKSAARSYHGPLRIMISLKELEADRLGLFKKRKKRNKHRVNS